MRGISDSSTRKYAGDKERFEAKLGKSLKPNRVRPPNHQSRGKIVRKPIVPLSLAVMANAIMLLMAPAWAQTITTEQELLQIRQKMAGSFSEAVKNKDAEQAAGHDSQDVVFSYFPVQTVVVGREAMQKRWENIFKSGAVTDYSSTPKEAHLIGDSAG
jgi:hypothetical protein